MGIKQFNDLPVLTEVDDYNNYIIERNNNLLQVDKTTLQNTLPDDSKTIPFYYVFFSDNFIPSLYWNSFEELQQDIQSRRFQFSHSISELAEQFTQGQEMRFAICLWEDKFTISSYGIPVACAQGDNAKKLILVNDRRWEPSLYNDPGIEYELPAYCLVLMSLQDNASSIPDFWMLRTTATYPDA